MEQFGLALTNGTGGDLDAPNGVGYLVNYSVERGADARGNLENGADNTTNGVHPSVTDADISNLSANASYHTPQLYPLIPEADYAKGAGAVNANYDPDGAGPTPDLGAISTEFAFSETSNTIPVAIATENNQV